MKKCNTCNKEKPITDYHKQKNGKFGVRAKCKDCCKEYRKIYTSTPEYKEYHKNKQKEWRKNNREKALEISRRCYAKNADKLNSERRHKYHNDKDFKQKCLDREKKYKDSGRRYEVGSKPEQRKKSIERNKERRKNIELKQHDYKCQSLWRKTNKEYIKEQSKIKIVELKPSYVACSMRMAVGDLTPEILETKRLIIQLKRELKTIKTK